jgi:hypothetical protein
MAHYNIYYSLGCEGTQSLRTQYWYRNGNLHRVDGPAVIYRDDKKYWFLYNRIIVDYR